MGKDYKDKSYCVGCTYYANQMCHDPKSFTVDGYREACRNSKGAVERKES